MKPGRNDPCPCGSGTKYKHCCLPKAAADPALWAEVRAASDHLAEEILRFAVREFGAHLEDAWDDFHLGLPEGPFDPESTENAIFMPYFLFHWNPDRPPASRTGTSRDGIVAKAFLHENSGRLTEMERQLLEQSTTQPLSFYEILSSQPGEGIALREILTGQETQVRERSASKAVQTGDIIFAQITPMPGITILCCSAPLRIPPGMKAEVIALRKKLQRRAEREGRTVSAEDLVRCEEDIREVYLDIRDILNAPPRIRNTDGDPLVLHTIRSCADS